MEKFTKLKPTVVKGLYKTKILTAKAYLLLWMLASTKIGWKLRGNLWKRLEMPKRTFYQAVKDLAALGIVETNGVEIWVVPEALHNLTNGAGFCTDGAGFCTDGAESCTDGAESCTDGAGFCTDGAESCTTSRVKSSNSKHSGIPSDLSDLSQISTDLSPPTHHPEREEEEERTHPHQRSNANKVWAEKLASCEGKFSAAAAGFSKISDVLLSSQVPKHLEQDLRGSESLKPTDREILEFIERSNPTARNPRAYARSCLRNDRKFWEDSYQNWKEKKIEGEKRRAAYENPQAYEEFRREEEQEVDRETVLANLRRIKELISSVRGKST